MNSTMDSSHLIAIITQAHQPSTREIALEQIITDKEAIQKIIQRCPGARALHEGFFSFSKGCLESIKKGANSLGYYVHVTEY